MGFIDKLKKFLMVNEPVSRVDQGWRAADVHLQELVDDEWIKKNTKEVK